MVAKCYPHKTIDLVFTLINMRTVCMAVAQTSHKMSTQSNLIGANFDRDLLQKGYKEHLQGV